MISAGAAERIRLVRAGLCAAFVLLLATAGSASAAPADLDRSFGGDGIVGVEGPGGASFSPEASARMAIGPNDEVFVLYSALGESLRACGAPSSECVIGLSLVRYDRDANRDLAFGTGPGSQLSVRQSPLAHEFALAVGPDGKPVVAANDSGTMAIARFDSAGHLDGTFGVGGVAAAGFPGGVFSSPAVAVQADGKVVVGVDGGRGEGATSSLLLARLQANGERDPGFGNGGEVVAPMATRSWPAGILLGGDGTISVASPQCCGGSPLFGSGFSFARFLANGQPDQSLAGRGQAVYPTPGTEATVEAAALAPGGGIFAVFEESTSQASTVGNVTKLLPDGSVDHSFGNEGRLRLYTRVGAVDPSGIAVDPKGRIVGVGWDGSLAAFRLLPNGGKDRTFNGGQHVSLPFGGNQEAPLGIGLQSSGRIVTLGETSCCGPKALALVALRGGSDRTRCLKHKATIVGTQRADKLIGTPRRDVIAALGGKDEVRGLSGADLICGGKGRDRLFGGAGRDEVRQ
jgi:uncharacterized delta-60 repeat protein